MRSIRYALSNDDREGVMKEADTNKVRDRKVDTEKKNRKEKQ